MMPESHSFQKRKLPASSADKAGRGVKRRQNVVHFPWRRLGQPDRPAARDGRGKTPKDSIRPA